MIRRFAPAKINLYLHVVGRRADGYHQLDSLAVFAGTGDWLTAYPASDLSLTVSGPMADGLAGEGDNIVLKAARILAEHAGITPCARLELEKHLPVSSGIGGGSADAAAALGALSSLWNLSLDATDLAALGLRLGADLPICLAGQPCFMGGIGEILTPAPPLPPAALLLVNPGTGLSTPAVFKARSGGFSDPAPFETTPRDAAHLARLLASRGNDLTQAAQRLVPQIKTVLEHLSRLPDCLLARMSGSGATCFALFATLPQADHAARLLRTAFPQWWIKPCPLGPPTSESQTG